MAFETSFIILQIIIIIITIFIIIIVIGVLFRGFFPFTTFVY
jgi:hypothetical protein